MDRRIPTVDEFDNIKNVNEKNNDFVASYNKTEITIKDGYDYTNESLLEALYEAIGKAIKGTGISVKEVIVKLK